METRASDDRPAGGALILRFPRLLAGLTIASGGAGLLARLAPIPFLDRVLCEIGPIRPSAAAGFLGAGLSLILLERAHASSRATVRVGQALGGATALIGTLSLAATISGGRWDLGPMSFPRALVCDIPGGLPAASALTFVLIGSSLVLQHAGRPLGRLLTWLLFATAWLVAIPALAFLYGGTIERPSGWMATSTPMAIVTLSMLSAGLLLANRERWRLVPLLDPSPEAATLRRLLLAVLLWPALGGAVLVGGVQAGLYDVALGTAILVTIGFVFFAVLIWYQASDLVDARRVQAEAEARFHDLVEFSPDGILAVDEDGIICVANEQVEQQLGWPRGALIGQSIEILLPEALRPSHVTHRIAFQQAPSARRMGKGRDLTALRNDGTEVSVEVSLSPLRTRGRKMVIATMRDVTERHDADRALRASEERYREMFMNDLTGAYISTPGGRMLACNPSFASMFGFSSIEEALLMDISSAYKASADRQRFLNELQAEGRLSGREVEYRRPDGKPLHVIESSTGVLDDRGELKEIRGYLIDTTERKQLEAQLRQAQKMEAVGQLAGGVAHDFNNILTVILGFSELLLPKLGSNTRALADVEEIRKAGHRAADLTRQLLAFSRRQIVQPVVLDVSRALTNMDRLLRRLLDEHIEMVTVPSTDEARVKIDPGQLEQLVTNLVVNARDAMPEGGRLVIEVATEDVRDLGRGRFAFEPGRYVVITVRDTGTGIDPETQSHIFEPFFTTKGPGKGTGLGLSTVYGIVKQANGFIDLSSEPGNTTFKIYLSATDEPLDSPHATTPPDPGRARPDATILVVEDDAAVRELIATTLTSHGFKTLIAGNGAEAVGLLDRHGSAVDLVLTDVVMPEMGGRSLADHINRSHPNTKTLFMSGYPTTMLARHGVLKSSVRFLAKPFSPDALISMILAMLA